MFHVDNLFETLQRVGSNSTGNSNRMMNNKFGISLCFHVLDPLASGDFQNERVLFENKSYTFVLTYHKL